MTIIRDLIEWPEPEPRVTELGAIEIVCARCHKVRVVEPDEPVPDYCGPTCRTKARRRRAKRRNGLGVAIPSGPVCPHPNKARYADETGAERARTYRFPRNAEIHTYPCRCGWWHIGHGGAS